MWERAEQRRRVGAGARVHRLRPQPTGTAITRDSIPVTGHPFQLHQMLEQAAKSDDHFEASMADGRASAASRDHRLASSRGQQPVVGDHARQRAGTSLRRRVPSCGVRWHFLGLGATVAVCLKLAVAIGQVDVVPCIEGDAMLLLGLQPSVSRCCRFFTAVHRCLVDGGKACFQFYPTVEQAKAAVMSARR